MSDIGGISSASGAGATSNSLAEQQQINATNVLVQNARMATSGARGSLASGGSGGAVTVLGSQFNDDGVSLFGSLPSQNSQIMNRIIETAMERFKVLQQQIDDQAAQRSAAIEAQDESWIRVKAGINNAAAAVTNGQEGIEEVRSLLLTVRGSISLAGQNGEDTKLRAGQFDDTFNQINNYAEVGGQGSNIVGNINRVDFTPNKIQYSSDPQAAQSFLNGTYIGTDYRIRANDGTVWIPELGTDTLTHYSEIQGMKKKFITSGIELDDSTSTRTGVKLVSYDANTRAITVNITINPDEPPRVVTGTLDKTGIGLMPSWFYDGLTTDAGRKRAHADVNRAEVNVTSAAAAVQIAANTVSRDSNRVDAQLGELTRQSIEVQTDQLKAQQELQEKSVQQLVALQTNLKALKNTQQNYLNMLASSVTDPVGSSLLNMQI